MSPIRVLALMVIGLALSGCGWAEWPAGGQSGAPKPPPKTAAPAAPSSITVASGETIYAVAQRAGVPVRDLIEANGLQPPYRLSPGRRLILPAARQVVVARGDTLYAISRAQGVDMYALARANNLAAPYRIYVGQRLKLPGRSDDRALETAVVSQTGMGGATVVSRSPYALPSGEASASPEPPPATSGAPAPAAPPVVASAPADTGPPPAPETPMVGLPDPPPRGSGKFQWPVKGKLVSVFGNKDGGLHNDGVNISAPRGTPVRAAEAGVVAYAGNELRGFGNLLLIKHADGWVTAYGHNETLLVKKGDKVERGQVIGTVGATGNVDAPQLHFEVRRGKKAEDPLPYLG